MSLDVVEIINIRYLFLRCNALVCLKKGDLLEGEMTGDRRGESSRWLSLSGLQKKHSLMLQKLRLSPPKPLPGLPLKSRSGESDRLML